MWDLSCCDKKLLFDEIDFTYLLTDFFEPEIELSLS
jgi:hypothetical protein